MIHEVEDWMLNLDLSEFDVITFDDGLVSQYNNLEHFLKLPKPKIFFISTGIVCPEETTQNNEVITCSESHSRFFKNGDLSNYMKWSQIKEINEKTQCFIGGHSHTHPDLREVKIIHQYKVTQEECYKMVGTFDLQNLCLSHFAYPYNYEALGYKLTLKEFGIPYFFGKERIAIESLK